METMPTGQAGQTGQTEQDDRPSGLGRAKSVSNGKPTAGGRHEGNGFDADVVVIGAGLAGLTAAAYAARGGASVLVLERTQEIGGRAATHFGGRAATHYGGRAANDFGGRPATDAGEDFRFNVGPHALYDGGPAARAFAELGVAYSGRRPPASGGLALRRGRLHALPGGFVSLLTTDLVSLTGKLELGRVLGSLGKTDASALRGQTLRQWLDATFRDPVVRELLEALMRLTSYANDPGRSCAAASVAQLQHGLGKGVLYVDDGWATLAGGLRKAAESAGARVHTGRRVSAVHAADDHVVVTVDGASAVRARTVILAVPLPVAAALARGPGAATLAQWAGEAVPVKAACLDLGLRRLPDPRRLFVLGVDQPLYFSVHSASARLAPEGAAMIHVAKYLGPGPSDAKAVESELEAFCDIVQPGWRREVARRRYLPSMLVTGALVAAGRVRPGPVVPDSPSLLVAGDWVGDEAMIADTAVASGRLAGLKAGRR